MSAPTFNEDSSVDEAGAPGAQAEGTPRPQGTAPEENPTQPPAGQPALPPEHRDLPGVADLDGSAATVLASHSQIAVTPEGGTGGGRPGSIQTTLDEFGCVAFEAVSDADSNSESSGFAESISGSRYMLHGEIARGGMGAILKGRDLDLGRDLAIKVLLESQKERPDIARRFIEEAQIGGQLQHPGIAPVYQLGQFADGRLFFSMKLVQGETLSKLLKQRRNPAEDRGRFIGIFGQVCQTMAYAHSQGAIHRDLKPANIMVGAFGEVQVMDWGLGRVRTAAPAEDSVGESSVAPSQNTLRTIRSGTGAVVSDVAIGDFPGGGLRDDARTQAGSIMGTPAYMPPEQAQGEVDRLDQRADVFGLGAILCEILTGQPPYVGNTGAAVFQMASRGQLDDCFQRLEACGSDAELVELAKHCLAADPEQRPRDAGVVAERVAAYQESVETKLRETELRRATESARVVELRRRRRLVYVIGVILLAVSVVAVFEALHFQSLEETQRTLALEKAELASKNAKLADEREQERNDAIAAREEAIAARETAITAQNEAVSARDREATQRLAAEEARQQADASATLAEDRASEIRKTLYAAEMHQAFEALQRTGGLLAAGELLDHWRPQSDDDEDLRGWEWYYLRAKLERAELVLSHESDVIAAEWSPDGRRVYVAGSDGSLHFWDADTGRRIRSVTDATDPTRGMSLSPDGQRLATLHSSGAVRIRNVDSDEPSTTFQMPPFQTYPQELPITWSPDGTQLALCRGDSQVAMIAADTGNVLKTLDVPRPERVIRWHSDGKRLAVISGQDLMLWEPASDKSDLIFHTTNGGLPDVLWSSDERLLVVDDRLLSATSPGTPVETWLPTKYRWNRPYDAGMSPSRKRLAVATSTREIQLIDVETRELTQVLTGHTERIRSLVWSPDGSRFLSVGHDQTVRIWRDDLQVQADTSLPPVLSVGWRPGSGELATSEARELTLRRYPGYEARLTSPVRQGLRISWAADGQKAAVGSPYHTTIVGAGEGERLLEIRGGEDAVGYNGTIAFEPQGDRLVILNDRDWGRLYSAQDGSQIREWRGLGYLPCVAWHPAGGRLALSMSGSFSSSLRVFGIEHEEPSEDWRDSGQITAMAWHPSGDLLATARTVNFLVELWGMPGAEPAGTIEGGSLPINSLAWSPDGSLLAIGSQDGTVRFWNRHTRQVVFTLHQEGDVQKLDWDHTGTRLAIQRETGLSIHDAARGFIAEDAPNAIAPLNLLVDAEPDRALYRLKRAELLEQAGRWSDASSDWEALGRLNPQDDWYAERKQWASLKSLPPADAVAQLDARLADTPDDLRAARVLSRLLIEGLQPDNWTPLRIDDALSEGGAFLLPQPDGSLLAAGENPAGDVYRLQTRTDLRQLTAIRLESIPDDRLPEQGAGRAYDGNFQLGDITVSLVSDALHADDETSLRIIRGWADHHYRLDSEELHFPIENAFDDEPDVGWDSGPNHYIRHQAVFDLEHPEDLSTVKAVGIRLTTATRNGAHPIHNLGRFRLSATDRPHASIIADVNARLSDELTFAQAWSTLGTLRLIRGETEAAAQTFGRALDAAADDVETARTLAAAARDESVLTLLLDSHPQDASRLATLADTLAAQKELHGAIALSTIALKAAPADRQLRLARCRLLTKARLWREAANELAECIDPQNASLSEINLRAEAFEKSQRWTDAIPDLLRLRDVNRGNPGIMTRLGTALINAGRNAEALAERTTLFQTSPDDTTNWLWLAPLLVTSGDTQAYEAFRSDVAHRVKRTEGSDLSRALKVCLLTPASKDLLETLPVQELTDILNGTSTVELSPDTRSWLRWARPWGETTLTLVKLRRGDAVGAEADASVVIRSTIATQDNRVFARAIECLAMAQQGKTELARTRMRELTRQIQTQPSETPNRLIADILRREAESLLTRSAKN